MDYINRDSVAVLTIDNPPVNALTSALANELAAAIDRAGADPAVRAIVVTGAGRTFVAGVDITVLQDMAWGEGPGVPLLHALLQQLEDSPKPVVMALNGSALGGGLELAMAGHYRVALRTAQVGQPEVNLGIIPGAEGTQRLPRLVGVQRAIEMVVSGKPLSAEQAQEAGLVDEVYEDDLLDRAIAFARHASVNTKTRDRREKLGATEEMYEAGRALAAKTRRGQIAPSRAIEAIGAAVDLPFDEGCSREMAIFRECVATDQAKAMMHVFFAERASAKAEGEAKFVGKVGILGAGTMGGGIAMAFANAGIPVLLRETSAQALDSGMATIKKNYGNSVNRGRFTSEQAEKQLALIQPQLDLDGFETVDLILEAAFENMSLKKEIFREMDSIAKTECILATNTSSLNVDEIAGVTDRPEAVLGMHFFSPANVMRLLEIVRGKATAKDVVATGIALAKRLKKVGVVVGNCPGFVGNRMFFPYMYEAQFLAEEGATPEQVDRALTQFGMAMGVFAVDDLAGIDVAWRVRQELHHFSEPGIRRPLVQDQLYAKGWLGQKTGRGWYRYGADRTPVVDTEVMEMIESAATSAGIRRHAISDESIVERTIYLLINEGARILEEGYAARASDIDVIYVNGYGFPPWRGGPMMFASLTGLDKVLGRIEEFHREFGQRWQPAPLLRRLANEGRTFRDFDRERRA